jgi:uncharacterized protein with NRDE domain
MNRPTSKEFRQKKVGEKTLYFPEDLEAHGSWIGFYENGTAACLLNGGTKSYKRKAPYRKSRGLVVLESFEYKSVTQFYDRYNFDDIEPFTLIIRSSSGLYKITHDVDETKLDELNSKETNIWSSTTLYTEEVRNKRQKWFESWLAQKPEFTPDNIRAFHNSAGDGDSENDLIMSRWGMLKTLSITQISVGQSKARLIYQDFMQTSGDIINVDIN